MLCLITPTFMNTNAPLSLADHVIPMLFVEQSFINVPLLFIHARDRYVSLRL